MGTVNLCECHTSATLGQLALRQACLGVVGVQELPPSHLELVLFSTLSVCVGNVNSGACPALVCPSSVQGQCKQWCPPGPPLLERV